MGGGDKGGMGGTIGGGEEKRGFWGERGNPVGVRK